MAYYNIDEFESFWDVMEEIKRIHELFDWDDSNIEYVEMIRELKDIKEELYAGAFYRILKEVAETINKNTPNG